ncbi:MAG: zinc ribbon domain-containing protein, partial [Candidatus Hodarchaeota archaeon]
TSKLCWRCRSLNTEIRKRCFRCKDCGLEYNRDLNGAINIGNRLLGYMLKSRASVNTPQTSPEYTTPLERRLDNVSECEGGSSLQQLGTVH